MCIRDSHNSAASRRIATKFGRLKQNRMRRTKHRSRSKSEVKFQYGDSRFSETGSSYISVVDWDTSSKFGMQTDFHLRKRMQSLPLNTEVVFGLHGSHLEKSLLRHNFSSDRLTETKFGMLMQNHMTMTTSKSKLKQEIEFQYGDRPFSQTGSNFIATVDWDISSKIWYAHRFSPFWTNAVTKPELRSSFPTLWPPSRKIDMTSEVRRCLSDYDEISQADATWHADNYTYTVGQNGNWKWNSNLTSIHYLKPEVVLSQP